MGMMFKNTWGAEGSNLDQQRADLFWVSLNVPVGGRGVWDNNVRFAVKKFPFPEQQINTYQVKYLQQVNNQIGGDNPVQAVVVPVRYAFAAATAQVLYQWMYLISNPRTGGTGNTSYVKCQGRFQWLIPDMSVQGNPVNLSESGRLKVGMEYILEGCFISGLKPTDADAESSNTAVDLAFNLHMDRYYPADNPSGLIYNSGVSKAGSFLGDVVTSNSNA